MNDVSVVLAHGGWVDGSSWARVITGLAAHGVKAVAAPLPLTELADDVEAQYLNVSRDGMSDWPNPGRSGATM